MSVQIHKITNGELLSLHSLMEQLLVRSDIPMKFTLIKNYKELKKLSEEILFNQDLLFKSFVVVDLKGDPVIKEQYKDDIEEDQLLPYEAFEYQPNKSIGQWKEIQSTLLNEFTEISLIKEDRERVIKVSFKEEGKTFYENITLGEFLEDPHNNLEIYLVLMIEQYMLD